MKKLNVLQVAGIIVLLVESCLVLTSACLSSDFSSRWDNISRREWDRLYTVAGYVQHQKLTNQFGISNLEAMFICTGTTFLKECLDQCSKNGHFDHRGRVFDHKRGFDKYDIRNYFIASAFSCVENIAIGWVKRKLFKPIKVIEHPARFTKKGNIKYKKARICPVNEFDITKI